MGFYIQGPTMGKVKFLIDEYKAQVFLKPDKFSDIPKGFVLICVVSNGPFEAAAIIYSENEFQAFAQPTDTRPKTCLIMDIKKAIELSGIPPDMIQNT